MVIRMNKHTVSFFGWAGAVVMLLSTLLNEFVLFPMASRSTGAALLYAVLLIFVRAASFVHFFGAALKAARRRNPRALVPGLVSLAVFVVSYLSLRK